MKVLIDGDILVYRTGFSCKEGDPEWVAQARLEKTINLIMAQTNCYNAEIYLSDSLENNFRYNIFPLYKGNRKSSPKPLYYEELYTRLATEFCGEVAVGEEADDAIGIRAKELGDQCIIVSIDKDLLQIPGEHFNWVSSEFKRISEKQGIYRFYCQLMAGDTTDNICGSVGLSCPGVGQRKAERILEGCSSIESYNLSVYNAYRKAKALSTHDEVELLARIETTGQLVKIRQEPGEIWKYDYKEESPSIQKQVGR